MEKVYHYARGSHETERIMELPDQQIAEGHACKILGIQIKLLRRFAVCGVLRGTSRKRGMYWYRSSDVFQLKGILGEL